MSSIIRNMPQTPNPENTIFIRRSLTAQDTGTSISNDLVKSLSEQTDVSDESLKLISNYVPVI